MWSNFEASSLEDETISNIFSSRGIFQISSEEEVSPYCAESAVGFLRSPSFIVR